MPKGIQRYFKNRNFDKFSINIVLIGLNLIEAVIFVIYRDLFDKDIYHSVHLGSIARLTFMIYNYDINGLKFKEEYGFSLTNEGF